MLTRQKLSRPKRCFLICSRDALAGGPVALVFRYTLTSRSLSNPKFELTENASVAIRGDMREGEGAEQGELFDDQR